MSKIGQKKITVPSSVTLEVSGKQISVIGSAGSVGLVLPGNLELVREGTDVMIKRAGDDKKNKSLHGLFRQLLANMVVGVEKPWEKRLEVVGTGYNVKMQGEDMVFKIGYSHPVVFKAVPGIKFKVEGNNKIVVLGADRQMVGQIAYQIKLIKKPDVYKGKGIKYEDEKLRIKPGKKAKAAGPAAGAAA
jgi:large subunit ribosomal protein L6